MDRLELLKAMWNEVHIERKPHPDIPGEEYIEIVCGVGARRPVKGSGVHEDQAIYMAYMLSSGRCQSLDDIDEEILLTKIQQSNQEFKASNTRGPGGVAAAKQARVWGRILERLQIHNNALQDGIKPVFMTSEARRQMNTPGDAVAARE